MPEDLQVHSLALGPLGANCFVVARGRDALVIDPGDDAMAVIRMAARLHVTPEAVLLTHGHFDHFGAAEQLARLWKVPVYIGSEDAEIIVRPELGPFVGTSAPAVTAELVILDGESQLALAIPALAIPTPGHSLGSYTFSVDDHLFSGDLLFFGGVGRSDLPGGSMRTLMESIAGLMRRFPLETVVHCGHGPDTTLKRELARNPFLESLRHQQEFAE